ncbi:MAG: integrase arm-type DNA-binding domain-containing protein [Gallionella sp.]|nr:integrase arm-type DNA-binding domain-containing protein [Gallionella sp.]
MSLTEKELLNLKPEAKGYKRADGHGLYIEVLPSGGKSWRLKYRFGGKEKRITFGLYPVVSLKKAREEAFIARQLLSNGIDPGQAKKSIATALKVASSSSKTLKLVLDELLAVKIKRVSEKHLSDYKRSMEMHVLPFLGERDIADIKADEIIKLGQKTEEAGLYLAHRIIQRIGEVMEFAVTLGYREMNPVTKKTYLMLTQHVRTNNPAIDFCDMPEFLHDLSKYRG